MTKRQDLDIRQGTTWSFTHTVFDSSGSLVDLTGYSARMAIKISYGAGNVAYLSDGADVNGGTLTLGGGAGTVVMAMSAAQSSDLSGYIGLPLRPKERTAKLIYDLELIGVSDTVSRELEGRIILHREITE